MADRRDGSGDDYDIAAPRNIVALIVVQVVVLAVSKTYGHRYVYAGVGAVALMRPLPTAVVAVGLCLVGVTDPVATLVVLGAAFVCRAASSEVGRRRAPEPELSPQDREAFEEALEHRAGRWYVDHARLAPALLRRLRTDGLVARRAVPRRRGADTPKLSRLTASGARLALRQLLADDLAEPGRLWAMASGSATPVHAVVVATAFALLMSWRTLPETVDVGSVARDLGRDLDAEVTPDEFATAARAISRAGDARALFRPLACRLFLADDDDAAVMALQALLLANGSFDDFEERCPRVPDEVATIEARAEVVYVVDARSQEIVARAAPVLAEMGEIPRFVGSLRVAACLNDARGDRLTAGHQLTVARAFQALKQVPTSGVLEELCPAPTSGYVETGSGTDILIRPTDHRDRIEEALG